MTGNWNAGPVGFPTIDPGEIHVGSILVSPKGTRWVVMAQQQPGWGASYLMRDERGNTERRSYQNVRTWHIEKSPSMGC